MADLAPQASLLIRGFRTCTHCAPQLLRRTAADLLNQSPQEEFSSKLRDMRLGVALCALTVLRYLTDHLHRRAQPPLCGSAHAQLLHTRRG